MMKKQLLTIANGIFFTFCLNGSHKLAICSQKLSVQVNPDTILWAQRCHQFDPSMPPIANVVDEDKPEPEACLQHYKKADSLYKEAVWISQLFQQVSDLRETATDEISDVLLVERALEKVSKGILSNPSRQIERDIQELQTGIDIIRRKIETREKLEKQIAENVPTTQLNPFTAVLNSFGSCLKNCRLFKRNEQKNS